MTRAAPFTRRRGGGFTLVELIVAMVVLTALATVASGLVLTMADSYYDVATTAQLHAELSVAMDRAVRELRQIPFDADAGGVAADIDAVTATSITWDDDYSLTLVGDNLMLTIDGGAAAVLMADVTTFEVQTYDESNAALAATLNGAACDAIRRIRLTLTAQRYGVSDTLRTRVFVRSTLAGAGA